MAQSYVLPLLSVLLLFNVYKCRGSGPISCDESGFPVCATNGTHWYFFKNMCLLNSENHDRENFNLPTLRPTDVSNCFNNCDQRCTTEFSPICATTQNVQKTFPNKCEFDLENCKSGNVWKFLYIGKCDQSRPLNPHPHVYPTEPQRRHLQPFFIPQSNTNSNPINLPDHRDLQQQHQHQQIHPTSPITPVPQLDKISFPHIQFNQNPITQGQHHLGGQNNPHNTQLAHLGQPVQHQLSISIPQQFSHPQNKPHVHQNLPIPHLSPKPISQVQPDPHFHSQQHPQPAVQPGSFHEPNESPLIVQPQQQFHSQPQNPWLKENPIQHQNIHPQSNPQENPLHVDEDHEDPQQFEQTNLQPQVQNQPIEPPMSQPHVRPHHHSLQQHPQPPLVQSESVSPIVVPHAQALPHSQYWQHPQPQVPGLNKSPIPQPHFIPQKKPHSYLHKQPQQAHLRPEVFQVLQHDQPHSQSYPQEHLRPQIYLLNEDKIPHLNTQGIQNPPMFQPTHLQLQDQSLSTENPTDYPISQPHAEQHHNSQQYLESPVDHVTVPEVIGNPIELQQAQPHPKSQTYIHQHSQPQNVEHHLNSQDIPHQQDRLQSQVQSLPTINPSDYMNSKQHVEPQHHFQQYPPQSPVHHEAFPELDESRIIVPHAQPQPQLQFQQHSQPQISWPYENPISQQHFRAHSNPQEGSHSQIFQRTQLQPQVQSPPNEKSYDYSISQPHHSFQQYLQSPVHPQKIPEVIKHPIERQHAQPHPQPETYIPQQSQPQNPRINEYPISQQHVEHHLNSQDLPHTQQNHLQSQVQSIPIKSPSDYHISQQHVEPHYHYQHYPPQSVVHPEAFPELDESPIAVPHAQPQPQLHFQQHSQPQIPRLHINRIPQQHFRTHSNPKEESHPSAFQQTHLQLQVNSLPIDKSNDYPIFQPHAVQHHNSQKYLQAVYPSNVPKLTKRPINLERAQPHPQIQSKIPRQFLRRWHNYKTLRQFRPFQRRRQYPKRTSNNTPIPGRRYQQIQLPRFQQRSHLNVRPQSHLNRQTHSQRYPISQPNIKSRPMSHYRPNVHDRPLKHYLKHQHANPLKYSHPFVLPRSQKLPVPSSQPNIRTIPQNANTQILPDFQPQSRSNPHSNVKPTSPSFTTRPQDFQFNTFLIPQPDIQQPFRLGFKDLPNPQVTTIPQPRQQPQKQFSESEHMQQPLMINSQCPTHCSLEYDPVCATFEDVEHTFDNSCYMKADICGSKRDWVVKHNGECIESESEGCNANCPRIYSPICATFNGQNQTFNNECLLDLEVCSTGNPWDYLHNGECRKSNRNCPTICPSIFSPVCASFNGIQREFPNQCFVLIEACRTKEDWKIVQQGKCGEETVPQFPQTSEQLHPTPSQQPTQLACPLCSDSYMPVCGVFNGQQQTFNNECLLLSENCYSSAKWTVAHEGECQAVAAQDPAARNCPNFCPLNYEPVCATFDGIRRTFPNECELNHEAYVTNKQWVILNVGECDYCPDCSNDVSPVCAELGGQTRTFDNACKLEAENCRTNSAWKIVSKNSCGIRNCPINCPNIYIPICGISNGEVRTFGNICEMRQEACNTNTAWSIASKGECPRPNENCPQSCSLQYNPVCAVYQGVTKEFINECFLRSESCKTHKNWEFVNAGQCADQNPHHLQDSKPGTAGTPTQMADPESNCQINKCLAFRDPVCATLSGEERTFLNTCFLGNVKCKTGEDWKIIKHGSCGKSSSSPSGSRILPKLIH